MNERKAGPVRLDLEDGAMGARTSVIASSVEEARAVRGQSGLRILAVRRAAGKAVKQRETGSVRLQRENRPLVRNAAAVTRAVEVAGAVGKQWGQGLVSVAGAAGEDVKD